MNKQGQTDLMWALVWLVLTFLTGIIVACLGGEGFGFVAGFVGWAIVLFIVRAFIDEYHS